MISAVIVSYKREENLPAILDSLRDPRISEIIIFNNNPKRELNVEGATVINSKKNWRCWAKYIVASMCNTKWVLSMDDDLCLKEGAIDAFLKVAEEGGAYGCFGLDIREGLYSKGKKSFSKKITDLLPVDILLGRIIFSTPERMAKAIYLRSAVKDWKDKPYLVQEGEDIVFSFGGKNFVVPGGLTEELSERGESLHKRKEHIQRRNSATSDMLKLDI